MVEQVAVLATGGTIASTVGEDAATPTESGADLVADVDDRTTARLYVEQFSQIPSPDMDFKTLTDLKDRIETLANEGIHGVVITHGTDTIEESAYFLDLVLDATVPVVFTGAQRRPDQLSPDGSSNLVTAVTAASNPELGDAGGVYVLLNDELHAAQDVTKAHTWKLEAFESPNLGPVALVGPGGFKPLRKLGSRSTYIPLDDLSAVRVEVMKTGIGTDGALIDALVADGVNGIVIEATGLGNTPAPVADSVGEAVDAGVVVVITSRCQAGTVAPIYGGGGGAVLRDRGAVFAGDLSTQKARIKLLVTLAADADPATSQAWFDNVAEKTIRDTCGQTDQR